MRHKTRYGGWFNGTLSSEITFLFFTTTERAICFWSERLRSHFAQRNADVLFLTLARQQMTPKFVDPFHGFTVTLIRDGKRFLPLFLYTAVFLIFGAKIKTSSFPLKFSFNNSWFFGAKIQISSFSLIFNSINSWFFGAKIQTSSVPF